jgi:hypothetical protein
LDANAGQRWMRFDRQCKYFNRMLREDAKKMFDEVLAGFKA